MKRWAYVQAMVDHDFDECHQPGETLPVCFRSTFVEAEDEDEAYRKGAEWSEGQVAGRAPVSLLNDYVFEV